MSSPAQLDVYTGSVVLISYFWYRTSLIRMTGKEKRTELDLCLKKYPTRERSLKKSSDQYRNQQKHPDETGRRQCSLNRRMHMTFMITKK